MIFVVCSVDKRPTTAAVRHVALHFERIIPVFTSHPIVVAAVVVVGGA
jgi:hypothetical protein